MILARLETLPEDIFRLFDPSQTHILDEDNLAVFAENVKALLRMRFKEWVAPENPLRFSSLGKPNRQIWFAAHPDGHTREAMLPKVYLKFLYGDLIEQLVLLLAKEAGHTVEDEQAEVEIDGVKGHIDAKVDGVVVDVKSASPFGYQKFEKDLILQDDAFGYVAQLSGYADVLTPGADAAWIANNKVDGNICVTPLTQTVIKHYDPSVRIKELKAVIASDEIPPLCYEPIPDGKSGNLKLPIGCSYCDWKFRCHPDVRTFIYSTGPRYLTKVVKLPDVPEVTR